MKWMPKDIIAIVVIVGAFVLLLRGIDTIVGFTLLGVVAAYYGIDLTPWLQIGRNQKPKKEET